MKSKGRIIGTPVDAATPFRFTPRSGMGGAAIVSDVARTLVIVMFSEGSAARLNRSASGK
jgi:hypothetical protein